MPSLALFNLIPFVPNMDWFHLTLQFQTWISSFPIHVAVMPCPCNKLHASFIIIYLSGRGKACECEQWPRPPNWQSGFNSQDRLFFFGNTFYFWLSFCSLSFVCWMKWAPTPIEQIVSQRAHVQLCMWTSPWLKLRQSLKPLDHKMTNWIQPVFLFLPFSTGTSETTQHKESKMTNFTRSTFMSINK